MSWPSGKNGFNPKLLPVVVSFRDKRDEKWCKAAGAGILSMSAAFGSKFKYKFKLPVTKASRMLVPRWTYRWGCVSLPLEERVINYHYRCVCLKLKGTKCIDMKGPERVVKWKKSTSGGGGHGKKEKRWKFEDEEASKNLISNPYTITITMRRRIQTERRGYHGDITAINEAPPWDHRSTRNHDLSINWSHGHSSILLQ